MSGYESIRDWSFEEYPIKNYDNFQDWLDDIENDFNQNGRGIDLNKIFDNQDYIDLENEFNERKGIDEIGTGKDVIEDPKERVQTIEEIFIEPIVKPVLGFFKRLFGR